MSAGELPTLVIVVFTALSYTLMGTNTALVIMIPQLRIPIEATRAAVLDGHSARTEWP